MLVQFRVLSWEVRSPECLGVTGSSSRQLCPDSGLPPTSQNRRSLSLDEGEEHSLDPCGRRPFWEGLCAWEELGPA